MGVRERERKQRILTGEEISFYRRSLMRRHDNLIRDMYKEYGINGLIFTRETATGRLAQVWNAESGC